MPNPDKTPKEKANQYQTEKEAAAAEQGKQAPPRALDAWDDIIGQRIEEAMRQGEFDNLPGHGKPQTLRRNPLVPADQALAFDILQNNNLAPAWIADRGAMLSAIEQWRIAMRNMV
ncbi:MAG: DUF1992 domain-containing protein, partial [Chloroflexota bacterium]|nr:DUF1992 domain-containing protein [Chloroflexota bacterium]